jgi:hypothetical protein
MKRCREICGDEYKMNNLDVQNMELEKGKVYLIKYEVVCDRILINTLVCELKEEKKFNLKVSILYDDGDEIGSYSWRKGIVVSLFKGDINFIKKIPIEEEIIWRLKE